MTRLSIRKKKKQYGIITASQVDQLTFSKLFARYARRPLPSAAAARSSRTYRYAKHAAVINNGKSFCQVFDLFSPFIGISSEIDKKDYLRPAFGKRLSSGSLLPAGDHTRLA